MLTVKKKPWEVPKSTKTMKITCNYITKRLKKKTTNIGVYSSGLF